ncbi:MAG: protein kinase [Pyrinomonadaceae bacterium]
MTPERWQKINEVFQSVLDLEPDKQKAFLEKACAEDESLRHQVETLLAANDEAGTFIGGNAAEDAGDLLDGNLHRSLTGENIGHYEIVSLLGSGGMGKVYLANDSKLNRPIAIKTIPVSYAPESDFVKRFITEAKAAANLNHANVATVYSVEQTDEDQFFITMEYVEGEPLGKLIPPGGLDQRTFLDWFTAIADALSHAHEKGIVHRDIKPNNIMITPAGTPKLLDFGLARMERSNAQGSASTLELTKTGQILGTPAYMSPEQAEGKQIDHRSDIFSFGVVMYMALTGVRPFNGDSYASVVSELMTKEPAPVSDLKPEAPYLLSRLIMKCLSKDPRYRYQSMREVRLMLSETRSALDSGASLSKPDNISYRGDRGVSLIVLYSLLGAVILLGALSGWYFLSRSSAAAPEVTKFQFTPDSSLNLNVTSSRLSPDGKSLVIPKFGNDGVRFYVRSLSSFETKPIAGTEGGNLAFFSPDSKWIAFSTKTEGLRKVSLEGGNPVTICDSCTGIRGGYWGEDNNIYSSTGKGIFAVSADGGTPRFLTEVDKSKGETEHYDPKLLPGGKALIFTAALNGTTRIGVFTIADSSSKYIEEAGQAVSPNYVDTGHIAFARGSQLMAIPFDLNSLTATGKPVLVQPGLFGMFPNVNVSENGTLLYLPSISRTNNQLVWVDRNGRETPAFEKKGDFSSPRISPDGTRVAVSFGEDIWVYDLKTKIGTRITDDGKNEIPMWSEDGESVIYSTEKDNSFAVYRKRADGTGEAEKLAENQYRIIPYSHHPTEKIISLTKADAQGNTDIVTRSLESGKTEAVVATKFREDTPRFSPDGRWLAYFSMDTGVPQIYALSLDAGRRKVPVTSDGGMFPVWSPAGKELFYRSANKFYSVTTDGSGVFNSADKKLLFEGKYLTSFDISPDGEKFLMVRDEYGTLPKTVNVVVNWSEELTRVLNSQN